MESNLKNLSESDIELLKRTLCNTLTTDELELFISVCNNTGLNPFTRQIYATVQSPNNPQFRKMIPIIAIDGFRVIAERSGKYAGQTNPEYLHKDGVWKDYWIENSFPIAIRIGVYKIGFVEPLKVTAYWSECKQEALNRTTGKYELKDTWQKMPTQMLQKCAESQALRKAFPQDLSGLYSDAEINTDLNVLPAKELKQAEKPVKELEQPKPKVTTDQFREMIKNCVSKESINALFKTLPAELRPSKDCDNPLENPYVKIAKEKTDSLLQTIEIESVPAEINIELEAERACLAADNCINVVKDVSEQLNDLNEVYVNLHPSLQENKIIEKHFEDVKFKIENQLPF